MPKKCTRRKKGERFGSARHERESGGTTALQIPPAGDCHSLSSLRIRGLEAHRFLFFFVEPATIKRRLSRFIKMRVNKSSAAWRQFRKKERVAARMHASKKKKRVHTAIEITRGVHTSGWLTGDPRYTDWSRTWRGKEITTMSVTVLREAGLKWGTGFTQPGDSETGYVIKKSLFYWPLCWT